MAESPQLNIYQKLAMIRDIADAAVKDKKGYNYTYADLTQILSKVKAGMKKYNMLLLTPMVPGTASIEKVEYRNTKTNKAGELYEQVSTEMLFRTDVVYTWVDCDKPEDKIEVPWFLVASMPDPSQSLGSACSYGMRQFLTSYFQIPQVEDVDAYRSKQREAENAEYIELAKQLIAQVDLQIKMYLADHQEDRDKVGAFVKKYIKSGDYWKIKESELAGKLLRDFTKTFMKQNPKED